MKIKLIALTTVLLTCTMITPVLAGKGNGGSGSSNRSQFHSGQHVKTGTMQQNQTRQQNQYRYQKNSATATSANKTRNQFRTRAPLTQTTDPSMETINLTPQTTENLDK